MEIPIIKIGNSKGLRLSKDILKQYNFTDKVELVMEAEHIILKPITAPREGWDEAFAQVKSGGVGSQLIDDVFDDEDFEPWK